MAGYVMHVAIAEEYLRKHKNIKENRDEFIQGAIYPDSVKDKSLTHYGTESSKTVLKDFLKENEIDSSFNRGYFLHLVTDYLFYNKYLDTASDDIYNDYDILNKYIIEKYNFKVPKEAEKYAHFKEGKTKILSKELAIKIITEISELDLDEIEKEIKEKPDDIKWTYYNIQI